MIIHPDVNAKLADYPNDGSLLVSNLFYTLQGEGKWQGCPATFLRLAGCNLGLKNHCEFCDTSFELAAARRVNPDDLVAQLEAITPEYSNVPLLVVTGGEPFLQNLRPFFAAMLRTRRVWRVQFETNGYFPRQMAEFETWFRRECGHNLDYMVSPKHNARGLYNEPPEAKIRRNWHYKFVVEAEGAYHSLPTWISELYLSRTWISPITVYQREPLVINGVREVANAWDSTMVDQARTEANYRYAARLCLDHGYRLSTQQHTFAVLE